MECIGLSFLGKFTCGDPRSSRWTGELFSQDTRVQDGPGGLVSMGGTPPPAGADDVPKLRNLSSEVGVVRLEQP